MSNLSPNYYQMPDGTQVLDITRWLTSNGGQAVQYIARATRSDGVVKGDRVEDLRKSIVFIEDEIRRLEGSGSRTDEPSAPRQWWKFAEIPDGVTFVDEGGDEYRKRDGLVTWSNGDELACLTAAYENCAPFTEVI